MIMINNNKIKVMNKNILKNAVRRKDFSDNNDLLLDDILNAFNINIDGVLDDKIINLTIYLELSIYDVKYTNIIKYENHRDAFVKISEEGVPSMFATYFYDLNIEIENKNNNIYFIKVYDDNKKIEIEEEFNFTEIFKIYGI